MTGSRLNEVSTDDYKNPLVRTRPLRDPLLSRYGDLLVIGLERALVWESEGLIEIIRDGGRPVLASGLPLLDEEIDGGGG